MTHSAQITNVNVARAFVLAGNSTFTLKSLKSGKHYTYKVKAPWTGSAFDIENPRRFVQLRTGSDEWQYLGFFYDDRLNAGKKGNAAHPAFRALKWFMKALVHGTSYGLVEIPADTVEFWHEGHCARCGRALTDPTSIERGFGPDCAAQLGMV